MTLQELKSRVLFQFNTDEDDLEDYEPAITGYINDGYDQLLKALIKIHLGTLPFEELESNEDEPLLPVWTHSAIADYATYMVYRNGNSQKQSRGQAYLASFQQMLAELKSLAASATYDPVTGEITVTEGELPQFINVYPPYRSKGFDPYEE